MPLSQALQVAGRNVPHEAEGGGGEIAAAGLDLATSPPPKSHICFDHDRNRSENVEISWSTRVRRPTDQQNPSSACLQPDLCDLCCAGRPHLLQEKSLRLRGPGPGPLLLSRLRQPAQQPVPGPERTDPLPQRGLLALWLPAVPLPGQYPSSGPENHQQGKFMF